MKYDDASWHYGGDFPKDLEGDAGATHIGMFVAWCMFNGFAGESFIEDFPEDLEKLKTGEMTPGAWFIASCDEKFTDEDLNEEGNEFAKYYYAPDESPYFEDYDKTVCGSFESMYHVPDTWDTYNTLEPVITERYKEWKEKNG